VCGLRPCADNARAHAGLLRAEWKEYADQREQVLSARRRSRNLRLGKDLMMRPRMHCLFAAVILACGGSAVADILELQNGIILAGKYAGGTTTTLRFETGTGRQVIETSYIENNLNTAIDLPLAAALPLIQRARNELYEQ